MELRDILVRAWKRRFIVGVVLLGAILSSTLLALRQPERFESTATLALTPDVKQGQGFVASDNLSTLLGTYAATAKSALNLTRAREILGHPLRATIESSTEGGTGILRVSARAESPRDARDAANATAQAFVESIRDNKLLVATIVDPPVLKNKAVQPRPPLIILVASLLGLFGGVVLALAIDSFRRRVDTSEDVDEITNVPVIGRLPRDRLLARGSAQIVWESQRSDSLQESYRALRTNLQFLNGSTPQVLEVTSSQAGEGKSTVVANLAVAFSQIGIRTIILDADLRRPTQHLIFGLDNRVGLSTAMALEDEEPELQPSGYPGLSVLPSGPTPPDPTEMLHIRLARVVASLREHHGLVLIDTPPLLPVSDARLIAPHTDGVLLVVAAGLQKPATLQSALAQLELVEATPRGVILNMSGQDADAAGGYYYSHTAEADPELELR